MKALQIKDFPPQLLTALKRAALDRDLSLRDFVIETLTVATLPPVVVGGTDQRQAPNAKRETPAAGVRTIEIKHSGKSAEINWEK